MPNAKKRNDGAEFEAQVEFLLRLRGDVHVERHRLTAGKNADLVIEERGMLLGPQVLAVECKDHARPLTHDQVTKIWSHYEPAVRAQKIAGLLLVTRNGLVPHAAEALAGLPVRHTTARELFDSAFAAERLLADADEAFAARDLDRYYQPAECHRVDVDFVARTFDRYYSGFVDFCLELGPTRALLLHALADDLSEAELQEMIDTAADLYERVDGNSGGGEASRDALLIKDIAMRRLRTEVCPLEDVVDEWLALDATRHPYGLALLGTYGTGKSSFARWLAARQADQYRRGLSDRIPLLIELRHFGSHQSIEGLVSAELANRHNVPRAGFEPFQRLNAAGRFLVILDGFDEMKEGMSKDALAYNFAELNRLVTGRSKVLLCGRPTVFDSSTEQRELLTRSISDRAHTSAQYIQAQIAPMGQKATWRAIEAYVKARASELGTGMDERLEELRSVLGTSESLRDLLSRPVHFPMLLKVMPTWTKPLEELTRAELYGAFIHQTIARELKPGRPPTISTEQRLLFASDLAVAMFASGESRSIRYAAIPDGIVLIHRRGKEPIDVLRRDLVRSCFLERKAPDLLFFGHKSFGEYLVAHRLSHEAAQAHPHTDRFGLKLTHEIVSFVDELFEPQRWSRVFAHVELNAELIRGACAELTRRAPVSTSLDDTVGDLRRSTLAHAVADGGPLASLSSRRAVQALRPMTAYHLANALEHLARNEQPLSKSAVALMETLAQRAPDFAAVHAFRGLLELDASYASFVFDHNGARWSRWLQMGWVDPAPVGA